MVTGDNGECHAVPVNRPLHMEYDRFVRPLDVCVSAEDWALIQKAFREKAEKLK